MDKQRFINEVNTRCEFNKYNHIFATDIEPELAVVEAELRPESMNPPAWRTAALCIQCAISPPESLFSVCRKICNAQRQSVFHAPGQGKSSAAKRA